MSNPTGMLLVAQVGATLRKVVTASNKPRRAAASTSSESEAVRPDPRF